jgi:hypothetical protein
MTLTGIMRYARSSVKETVNSMAAVASNNGEVVTLGMLLDYIPHVTVSHTRFH